MIHGSDSSWSIKGATNAPSYAQHVVDACSRANCHIESSPLRGKHRVCCGCETVESASHSSKRANDMYFGFQSQHVAMKCFDP